MQILERVFIVVDALDECTNQEEPFDLLTAMSNVNHRNHKGLTALANAISNGARHSTETLKLLSIDSYGMDIKDSAGRSPLMRATAIVKSLLDEGCDMNAQDDDKGERTTHIDDFGSKWCDDKTGQLWRKGDRPCGGHTALMYAVLLKHVYVANLLLEYGCGMNLRNNEGNTAIDLARLFDENEIVEGFEDHERRPQNALNRTRT